MSSKKVSFNMKYILSFVEKRKRDSSLLKMLAGRKFEHIKRINVLLMMKVIDNK